MSLVLEIEFLTGVCRTARGPGDDSPEWPPQPDRIFSALISAWGIRGEVPEERAVLEWLECQPPPNIRASGSSPRTAPTVYVPPNPKVSRKMPEHIPERRKRQPRKFPVTRPDDPNIELVWPDAPDTGGLDALNSLAVCVGYIGHSASLTRCRFHTGDAGKSEMKGIEPTPARRRVYPGRLRELEAAHCARPGRPIIRPGAPVFPEAPQTPEPPAEWLVLEIIEGEADIRASAPVCRLLRKTLMAGYQRSGRESAIPEIVSGHAPDGAPTRLPHLATIPMAFVGSSHADGRVLGFALIPPPGESLERIDGFPTAFEMIATYCEDRKRRILKLQGGLELAPAPDYDDRKRSLLSGPYLKKSSRWASVTPIVLERHLKRGDDAEIRELVAYACENAGLPRPDPERIRVSKHSAVTGVPPARPFAGEPPWMRWKMPKSLESRQLIHAVIEFEEEVKGPVLLGAGRFTGLGLCRGLRR